MNVTDTFNRMRKGEKVIVSLPELEEMERSDDPDVLCLATLDAGNDNYTAFLKKSERNIWVRCGDQDDYHKFANLGEVADYLASMLCDVPLYYECDMGVSDGVYYKQNNYISIYWGGADAGEDIDRGLTQEELKDLGEKLAAIHHEQKEDRRAKDAANGNLNAHMWYQD